jgi:type III secretion protein D
MSGDATPKPSETRPSGLELRIVSGVHAGARIPLPPPAESGIATLSVGPGLDHDVVLSDAPGSAQLRFESGEWRWAEPEFRETLRPESGWKWGAIVLNLATPGSDWSTPGKLMFDRSNPTSGQAKGAAASPQEPVSQAPPGADTPPAAAPAEPDDASGAPVAATSRALDNALETQALADIPERRGLKFAAAVMMVLVLGLIGAWLTTYWSDRPADTHVAAALPAQTIPSAQADPAAVHAALARAGLERRVRIIPLPDGRVRLSGVVADDDELDRAIAAVRPTTRRIVQGILTQKEFSARVAELQAEAPQPVTLRAAPVGRVLLIDADRPGIDVPGLKAWLARVLPESLEIAVAQPARLAEAAGAPPAPKTGPLAPAAAPAPVAAIAALPAVPANEPPLPDLPDIRLIIGGANPYVVLGSGEKWLPGGRVGGWYLAAIEAQTLVLQDGLGRQLRSPR